MDLVHIVYKSLIYFGILALVVIVGSYISYRIRRKITGQKFAYEEEIEKKEKAQKLAEEKAKKKEKEKKKHPVVHTKAQHHVEIKKHLKEKAIKEKREKIRKKSVTKTFLRKKRLEIINPQSYTPKIQSSESRPHTAAPPVETASPPRARKSEDTLPPKKKRLHSLDDDVFKKYADDEDDGLYTIKVKKSDE